MLEHLIRERNGDFHESKDSIQVLAPGTKVLLDGDIEARIKSVSINVYGIQYELIWRSGLEFKECYMPEFMFNPNEERKIMNVFTNQG